MRRTRSPLLVALFALLFCGAASVFMIVGARAALHQEECLRTYLPAPARIASSHVTRTARPKGDLFTVNILYCYIVDDKRLVSSTLSPLDGYLSSSASESEAYDLADAYPVGYSCTAYHAPDDPRQAFLLHRLRFVPYIFILFPMIHFEIGLAILLFNWGTPSPGATARTLVILAAFWDAVGLAAFGHFLACGGSLGWEPLIALALYGGLGCAATVLAWRKWSARPRPAADAVAADAHNPYRLRD